MLRDLCFRCLHKNCCLTKKEESRRVQRVLKSFTGGYIKSTLHGTSTAQACVCNHSAYVILFSTTQLTQRIKHAMSKGTLLLVGACNSQLVLHEKVHPAA